jgi:DNA-binding transcriptional ArsR family regulator
MVQPDLKYDDDPRVALLKELADPLRLRVIDRLGSEGPASPSELATLLGVPLPQLSNHLKRLRDAGLVRSQRNGRHVSYELADRGLPILVGAIDRLTGRVAQPTQRAESPFAAARTCYDHLGGGLGVALYRSLRRHEAVRDRPDGTIGLGPRSLKVFSAMGMQAPRLRGDRRRFAFECFDATEQAPHLGGALGDALAQAMTRQGWIEHEPGSRVVRLTDAGVEGLQRALGEPTV